MRVLNAYVDKDHNVRVMALGHPLLEDPTPEQSAITWLFCRMKPTNLSNDFDVLKTNSICWLCQF